MLKQIDVVYGTEQDEQALVLPILGVTPKDSLLVRKVTGLNPPSINLFIGDYARDGGIYQGRGVGNRNVVLTIDLNPNPALGETISGLRELLYKIFVDPRVDADYTQLILREDDGRARYIVGYVEEFETEPFDIETLVQISLVCPDPYVRDLEETVFSHALGWLTVPFVYAGTAEAGFQTDIIINTTTDTLTLSNNKRTMVITYPFLSGDKVNINTNRGARSVTLTRDNVESSLLAHLSPLSSWLELHSQANSMTVYGVDSNVTPAAITELRYTATYWGV